MLSITDIAGITVGHAVDPQYQTGCTVVLCPQGMLGGVDICGFAPGSRETELLKPITRVEAVHGVLLTGGSAFGLGAADGVVKWLAEKGYGLDTVFARVPLVPGAVIYDLNFNQSLAKPDSEMGYRAAAEASSDPVPSGNIGAGMGATCGKVAGFERAMKSGLGSAGVRRGELEVAALAVANPVGDILDPETGRILAGVRTEDGTRIAGHGASLEAITSLLNPSVSNTVICVVATNAKMDKVQINRVARMASTGIARAVRPAHLLYDGDMVFSLAAGTGPEIDENIVGALAAEVLAQAIANSAIHAESLPAFPAHRDMTAG